MLKKTLTAAALTGALVVGSAGVASAHECFIVNRSERGNVAAASSANWEAVPLSALFGDAHRFFKGPALTPTQVAQAVQLAEAQGLPSTITFFMRDTIPQGAPERAKDDFKGVDHFDAHIDTLAGIYWSFFPRPAA